MVVRFVVLYLLFNYISVGYWGGAIECAQDWFEYVRELYGVRVEVHAARKKDKTPTCNGPT